MRDDEYAGYCCLAIAILCNLNADEARKMYQYGPEHPLCQKMLKRKVRMAGLENLDRQRSGEVMKELLSQGYSVDAVSEAFRCFPSTVRRRVRETRTKAKEAEDVPEPLKQEVERSGRMNTGMKETGKGKEHWQEQNRQLFLRWQDIHEYGNADTMWTDGVSLNLIRQEMIRLGEILASYGESTVIPPEMPENYMANTAWIRKRAMDTLKAYLESEDYRYLERIAPYLTDRQQRKTRTCHVLGSIRNLKQAVEEGNDLIMREFGQEGGFDRLLADTAAQVRKLPLKKDMVKSGKKGRKRTAEKEDWQLEGQMSIYDFVS